MSGESYLTEVEVTVTYGDGGEVVICIDLGGELHVFDIESATALQRMIEAAIEFAEDVDEFGPHCEFDA